MRRSVSDLGVMQPPSFRLISSAAGGLDGSAILSVDCLVGIHLGVGSVWCLGVPQSPKSRSYILELGGLWGAATPVVVLVIL